MSIYSDYECGALSDGEFKNLCAQENRREMAQDNYCQDDFDFHNCIECANFENCLRDSEEDI